MRRSRVLSLGLVLASIAAVPARLIAADTGGEYGDFLKQVTNEVRAFRQARALYEKYAPAPRPGVEQTMLHEARVRHEVRRRAAAREPTAKRAPAPAADVLKLARELASKEERREKGLFAGRVRRLIASARQHIRDGRLGAATRALAAALRDDPRNERAGELLGQVWNARARQHTRRAKLALKRETAAAWREVSAARVPYVATLTLPSDWAERSARAKLAAAERVVSKGRARRAAVKKALGKKMSIDVIDTPVADVAAFLRNIAKINIVVEREAADKTVTLELKDVRMASVLDWVARQTGLAYTIRAGCVHIGPPHKIAEEPVVRVYDVSDILHVRRLLTRGHKMRRGALDNNEDVEPLEQIEGKSLEELAKELISFLKNVTGEEHWEGEDGEGQMGVHLGRLVVNAEPTVQEKILGILEHIR